MAELCEEEIDPRIKVKFALCSFDMVLKFVSMILTALLISSEVCLIANLCYSSLIT